MQITIKWTDHNTDEEGTYLYKSTSPIDPDILPEPTTVLGPGVTEYVDTDVVRNGVYYYRLGVFKGEDFALSAEIKATAVPYTGPGPQELMYGDLDCGFFGIIPEYEFFTTDELINKLGVTPAGTRYQTYSEWFKFAYKGKILFIPRRALYYNVNWLDLYNKGLVYGVDGVGDAEALGIEPVNQYSTVTRDGDEFIVRLPSAFAEPSDAENYGQDWLTVNGRSEYMDTIFRYANGIWKNALNRPHFDPDDLFGHYQYTTSLAMEINTTSKQALMLGGADSTTHYMDYVCPVAYASTYNSTPYVASRSLYYKTNWRPVLELIPT